MTNTKKIKDCLKKAKIRLLKMHYESKIGHIGGNLSAIDLMMYLHHEVMQKDDVFILSKGHAAGALYVTLWSLGELSEEELQEFHKDHTKMAGHPVSGWHPKIPVATGSLGHGFPVAAGMAFGKRLKNEKGRVFCLMSDGEWEEGSNWESLIFTTHHRLENLNILIDCNRLQAFGTTEDVASLEPLSSKLSAFGANIKELNGHNYESMIKAFFPLPKGPNFFICHTIKGHGVSFMEGRLEWHYLRMTEAQFQQAIKEMEAS